MLKIIKFICFTHDHSYGVHRMLIVKFEPVIADGMMCSMDRLDPAKLSPTLVRSSGLLVHLMVLIVYSANKVVYIVAHNEKSAHI